MFFYIFLIFFSLAAAYCAYQIFITDFRRRIIPDIYLFPLILIGLIFTVFYQWPVSVPDAVIGATFGYILSTVIGIIFDIRAQNKQSDTISPIGMGDIKLITTGGIWLGSNGLAIALIIACIGGTIWSKRKKQRYIPFAPFFLIGVILSLIALTFLI